LGGCGLNWSDSREIVRQFDESRKQKYSEVARSDIPVTETETDSEMIDFSKTHTETNTEKIFNTDTETELK